VARAPVRAFLYQADIAVRSKTEFAGREFCENRATRQTPY